MDIGLPPLVIKRWFLEGKKKSPLRQGNELGTPRGKVGRMGSQAVENSASGKKIRDYVRFSHKICRKTA